MTRECPVCRISLKQTTFKSGLELDYCSQCRGLWFDKGELTQTRVQEHLPDTFLRQAPALTRDAVICQACGAHNRRSRASCAQCGSPLEFLCPACAAPLEQVKIGQVAIDRCRACQGAWLDGGELALLFKEFTRKQQQDIERIRPERGDAAEELAAWAALDALDVLIWSPDIVYRAGQSAADLLAEIPATLADGTGAVLDGIGNIPEYASDLAGGAVDLASGAAETAGAMMDGALEFAGNLPEMAGSLAEAGSSFLEMLFELISSLFGD